MTTMREVAAAAGVSAKTVSRVFNDDPHVTPETRARVEVALRNLNYVPNAVATTFRTGRSPVVGIAVPDIVDPFFAAIAKSVGRLATQHGMSTVVTSLGEDLQEEADVVGRLLSQSLSGLIIAPVAAEHAYLEPWKERLPIVFVDRKPLRLAADSFTEDDRGGAAAGHAAPGRARTPPHRVHQRHPRPAHQPQQAARLPGRARRGRDRGEPRLRGVRRGGPQQRGRGAAQAQRARRAPDRDHVLQRPVVDGARARPARSRARRRRVRRLPDGRHARARHDRDRPGPLRAGHARRAARVRPARAPGAPLPPPHRAARHPRRAGVLPPRRPESRDRPRARATCPVETRGGPARPGCRARPAGRGGGGTCPARAPGRGAGEDLPGPSTGPDLFGRAGRGGPLVGATRSGRPWSPTAHPTPHPRTPSVGCAVVRSGARSGGAVRGRPSGERHAPWATRRPMGGGARWVAAPGGWRRPSGVRGRPVGGDVIREACSAQRRGSPHSSGRRRARPGRPSHGPRTPSHGGAHRAPHHMTAHPIGGVRSRPWGAQSPSGVRGRAVGSAVARWGPRSRGGVRGRAVGCAVARWGARSVGEVPRPPTRWGCAASAPRCPLPGPRRGRSRQPSHAPRTPSHDFAPHRWGAQSSRGVRSVPGVRSRPVGCAGARWGARSRGGVRGRPVGCAVARWGARSPGAGARSPGGVRSRAVGGRSVGEVPRPPTRWGCAASAPRCPCRDRAAAAAGNPATHRAPHHTTSHPIGGVRGRAVGCAIIRGCARAEGCAVGRRGARSSGGVRGRPAGCAVGRRGARSSGGVRGHAVGCAVARRRARSPDPGAPSARGGRGSGLSLPAR